MTIKYYIAKYDYSTKRNKIIDQHNDAFTALNALFMYVLNYLQMQDGCEKIKNTDNLKSYMFDIINFTSTLKTSLNSGHYIVRDVDNHIYKLDVWKKSTIKNGNGWLYGEYFTDKWIKIFDIDIIELVEFDLINTNFKQEIALSGWNDTFNKIYNTIDTNDVNDIKKESNNKPEKQSAPLPIQKRLNTEILNKYNEFQNKKKYNNIVTFELFNNQNESDISIL